MNAQTALLDVRQIGEADRLTVAAGTPTIVMMENAGSAVKCEILQRWSPCPVIVLCGPGNNGGDGFVAARHLAIRGAKTITFLVSPESKIAGDAAENLKIIRKMGLRVRQLMPASLAELAGELRKHDLVIDAIGGTGITGPLRGDLAAAVEQVNLSVRAVLAVDIPTGLDCDTGEAPGPTARAAMTVTMVARKKGFDAPGARDYTGEVIVADIGVDPEKLLHGDSHVG